MNSNSPQANEIHVWLVKVDDFGQHTRALCSCLSREETERSQRFRTPELRNNFVTARGVLKHLLGTYLGTSPARVAIGYSDKGKPFLDSPPSVTNLEFNLSHSGNAIGYVFSAGIPVGIDLEPLTHGENIDEIENQFLNDNEKRTIKGLPAHLRQERRLRSWTFKEALLKALGIGLGGDMRRYEILFDPSGQARLKRCDSRDDGRSVWTLTEVNAGPDLVVSIASACEQPAIIECSTLDFLSRHF